MESIARTGRGGWQENEITQLREAVRRAGGNGEPLRGVFEQIGASLGRKPNSVRNYYYACLKREEAGNVPHAAPFQTVTQDEVRQLVHDVLAARAQGVSVRACVQRMAGGNRKNMLRFQNKYRGIMKNKPELIESVRKELAAKGELPLRADDKRAFKVVSRGTGALPETQLKRLKAEINGLMMRVAAGIRKENAVLKDKLAALEIENLRLKNTLYGNGGKNSAMRFLSKGKNGGGGATAES